MIFGKIFRSFVNVFFKKKNTGKKYPLEALFFHRITQEGMFVAA